MMKEAILMTRRRVKATFVEYEYSEYSERLFRYAIIYFSVTRQISHDISVSDMTRTRSHYYYIHANTRPAPSCQLLYGISSPASVRSLWSKFYRLLSFARKFLACARTRSSRLNLSAIWWCIIDMITRCFSFLATTKMLRTATSTSGASMLRDYALFRLASRYYYAFSIYFLADTVLCFRCKPAGVVP